jgi:hypothetical protein
MSDIEKFSTGISGPQNNAKDLTDTVDIFEQILIGSLYRKC